MSNKDDDKQNPGNDSLEKEQNIKASEDASVEEKKSPESPEFDKKDTEASAEKPKSGAAADKDEAATKELKSEDSSSESASTSSTSSSASASTAPKADTKDVATVRRNQSGKTSAGGAGNSNGKGKSNSSGNGSNGKKGIVVLLVILIILGVLILAGLGWNIQRFNQQRNDVGALNSKFEQLQSQNHQQLTQASDQGQQFDQQLSQRMDQNDQTVKKVLDQLNRHQQSSPSDWTYAEVEYLLRIANQRLALQRDVSGAQNLLHMADERLASTRNPAFIPVRGQINNELASLDSVNAVDTDGLYLQLSAEQQQLNQLPLAQDTKALSAQVENKAAYSGGWREQLGRLGDQLEDLVTIRHHDKPLEALITPRQEGYLRANVRLLLEQAQIALLNQDSTVYQNSLQQAIDLVNQYYQTNESGVQKATQHLQSLSKINVHPDLPDISGSLNQLQQILAHRGSANNSDQGE